MQVTARAIWNICLKPQSHQITRCLSRTTARSSIKIRATHWAHDVAATLNQRQWRWFIVTTTSCAQWESSMHIITTVFINFCLPLPYALIVNRYSIGQARSCTIVKDRPQYRSGKRATSRGNDWAVMQPVVANRATDLEDRRVVVQFVARLDKRRVGLLIHGMHYRTKKTSSLRGGPEGNQRGYHIVSLGEPQSPSWSRLVALLTAPPVVLSWK